MTVWYSSNKRLLVKFFNEARKSTFACADADGENPAYGHVEVVVWNSALI